MVDYNSSFTGAQVDAAVGKLTGDYEEFDFSGAGVALKDFTLKSGVERFSVGIYASAITSNGNIELLIGDSVGVKTTGYAGSFRVGVGGVVAYSTGIYLGSWSAGKTIYGLTTFQRVSTTAWLFDVSTHTVGAGTVDVWGRGWITLASEITTLRVNGKAGTFSAGLCSVKQG